MKELEEMVAAFEMIDEHTMVNEWSLLLLSCE
jgi:hypothetical protein